MAPTVAPFEHSDSMSPVVTSPPKTSVPGLSPSAHRIRAYGNFSAGPACIRSSVLFQAQDEFSSYGGTGMSIMEMSHRDVGGPVQSTMVEAASLLRELLHVPSNYHILFMQGGAHGQFAALPLNLCGRTKKACYVNTGYWSQRAAREAERYCQVKWAYNGSLDGHSRIPPVEEWDIDPECAYVHICANETIHGLEFHSDPQLPAGSPPLVGDFTSTLLSRPVDVSKYGVIYASSGKNLGPAGVTVVIVRDDLVGALELPECPSVLSYSNYAHSKPIPNVYNTPPTFLIYMVSLVLQDYKDSGGLQVLQDRATQRAKLIYDIIDRSDGFYELKCKDYEHRSRMNVPFRIKGGDLRLEKAFVDAAREKGLFQLACHPKFPGCRITMYNGIPMKGVNLLADLMDEFMRQHS